MTPLAVLGLDATATPADIRRAYARLVRVHRPDEDAQAFQRLHGAYKACLAGWGSFDPDEPAPLFNYESDEQDEQDEQDQSDESEAQYKSDDADEFPIHAEPESPAVDPDLAALLAQHEAFDVEAFLDHLVEQLSLELSPAPLERWLHAHPALYDIALKQALADPVLERLCGEGPLRPAHLRVVFEFFDLDRVQAGPSYTEYATDQLLARGEAVFGAVENTARKSGEDTPAWLIVFLIKLMLFAVLASKGCSGAHEYVSPTGLPAFQPTNFVLPPRCLHEPVPPLGPDARCGHRADQTRLRAPAEADPPGR